MIKQNCVASVTQGQQQGQGKASDLISGAPFLLSVCASISGQALGFKNWGSGTHTPYTQSCMHTHTPLPANQLEQAVSSDKPLAALPPPALGRGNSLLDRHRSPITLLVLDESAPFSCPEREMGLTEASQWD